MKAAFFLFVAFYTFENIVSKNILLHENDDHEFELQVVERSKPKTESEDRVIWKRINTSPREESLTNMEESNDFVEQSTSQKIAKENDDMVEQAVSFENEKEISFDKQPLFDNSLEILDGQSAIINEDSLDLLLATSLSVELEPHNLTNAIIIDFSNDTGDAIVLDTFIENTSFDADLDEVSEMSKGEEIAFLHEMPTSSFEFLIDAHTRRNILLKELLGSQTVLSVEEDDIGLEHSLPSTDSHSRGNSFQEFALNDTAVPVGDKSEDEMEKEDNLHETTAAFAEIELRNSSENVVLECPQPGWCIFWFLSQDTCAANSHCLGSRICCKTGCSKTCVDV